MDTYDPLPHCSCCGGRLPAKEGADLDALDRYLTYPETGDCPGYLREDPLTGEVLGCGAWTCAAYDDAEED